MSLPEIKSTVTYGKSVSHAYMTDDPAILLAEFGVDSVYIVCSKQLATDVYAKNTSYSAAQLKLGLKDGWLILVFNPELFEARTNQLEAIKAIKSDEAIESGWYRLMVIPESGSRP